MGKSTTSEKEKGAFRGRLFLGGAVPLSKAHLLWGPYRGTGPGAAHPNVPSWRGWHGRDDLSAADPVSPVPAGDVGALSWTSPPSRLH